MMLWLLRHLRRARARPGLGLVLVACIVIVAVVGNAICFFYFDGRSQPEIGFGDALWYSVISITTIGYGDLSASSLGARLGTVLFIVFLGLSTFTLFLGMIIDWVTDLTVRGRRGMSSVVAEDHVLLVNFPGEARVRQVIEELVSDPSHRSREIVIVTDQIEELPFGHDGVLFVRGSPLEEETYRRASIERATLALVLATSYSDPKSDAVVASAVSVIDRAKPSIHIVAECLEEKHRLLFEAVRCDAIVPVLRIGGNLLAQEVHDPGVCQMIDVITSNRKGTTVFSAVVDETGGAGSRDYLALAKDLLDRDVNLLCVHRATQTLTSFRGVVPEPGDRVIYVASERRNWSDLRQP